MDVNWHLWFLAVILARIWQHCESAEQLHRKFEYKHSFRAPNLAQRDGTIPFWTISGHAIAGAEQLRLAPSIRSRKGNAWNNRVMSESEWFELEISLKVTGQGRVGADGLALWYTAQTGSLGPVYGSNDYWTGMGLMLDSFDNDNQKNNPFISLMINDGTRQYDHSTDGSRQMLSGCQRDFRNKPFPFKLKVEYKDNILTVYNRNGMGQNSPYELCLRAENVILPRNGYFGLSAATGGLADDHDILEFSVFSLQPIVSKQETGLPQDDQRKYDEEFEKQMKDYEKERQKFKEEHPDKFKEEDSDDFSKYFEESTARELRLIYESQNSIHQVMQQMDQKLQSIIQQQNQHTQLIHSVRGGGQQQQASVGGEGGGSVPDTSFLQHEKNEVLQTLRDLTSNLRDMRTYVNEIYTRTFNIEQKIVSSGTGQKQDQGQGQAYVQSIGGTDMNSVKAYLETIQADVRHVRTNQNNINQAGGYPLTCPTCLSSNLFLLVIGGQSIIFLILWIFRRGQEKAKFY